MTFFSLFLCVQSAPELGLTNYETHQFNHSHYHPIHYATDVFVKTTATSRIPLWSNHQLIQCDKDLMNGQRNSTSIIPKDLIYSTKQLCFCLVA